MFDFWKVQSEKPLFPDIIWSKPEQKSQSGKFAIIGGGANSFRGLDLAYSTAKKTGAGEVKVFAPDSLKKILNIESVDIIFAKSNISGGFSSENLPNLSSLENWADSIILIGDTNKSTETAILFEKFIIKSEKPVLIARDAVDILMNSFSQILEKENLTIVASFSQLQKIFQSVFYPKVITFSMQLSNLVEILHKFTLSFPSEIVTFHQESIIFAKNGEVFSMNINSKIASGKVNPLKIWSGEIPTKIAIWQTWNPRNEIKAGISGVIE